MTTKIFAIPFAGGSKYSYNVLKEHIDTSFSFHAIELAGRGERMMDELQDDIHQMAEDVFQQIKDQLGDDYILYGHSMGTILCYLVIKKIVEQGLPQPKHLVVSGAAGPSTEERERKRHLLNKTDFRNKLSSYGGSPQEVLDNDELFDFFEPILRNDFKAVETFFYEPWERQMDVPITVLIGLEEGVTLKEAKLWEQETTQAVSVRQFPGRHFFIYNYPGEVVKAIQKI